jgi:hypothetical protein
VHRGHDSSLRFRAERENFAGDAKGKGPSGGSARPRVPNVIRDSAVASFVAFRYGPPPTIPAARAWMPPIPYTTSRCAGWKAAPSSVTPRTAGVSFGEPGPEAPLAS